MADLAVKNIIDEVLAKVSSIALDFNETLYFIKLFNPDQARDARGRWVADSSFTSAEQQTMRDAVRNLPASAKYVGTDDTVDSIQEPVQRIKMSSFMPVEAGALDQLNQDKVPQPSKVMNVPLDGLTATQNTVRTGSLLIDRSKGQGMPSIVVVDGKPYVEDGHHRVAAAILAGRSTIRGEVYNVSRAEHFDS